MLKIFGTRYSAVNLWRGTVRRGYVHVLVLTAFRGHCPAGMEGCHNDGDPKNNRLSNLRWDTHSANQKDGFRHGTMKCNWPGAYTRGGKYSKHGRRHV